MRRLVSALARSGFAATLFLLILALSRLGPVSAAPPLPVRALPLALPCLLCAILAALSGRTRRPRPWRKVALALLAVLAALAGVVSARPTSGLAAVAVGGTGPATTLQPGALDLIGDDLGDLPRTRRIQVRWSGPLRAPESGAYRLWALGRGRVHVRLDGRPVLAGDGERLETASAIAVGRGTHAIEVDYERVGPGPRLRLGWETPRVGMLGLSRNETIPPRQLGEPLARGWWLATDALALLAAALVAALALALPWDEPRRLPSPRPVSRLELSASLIGQLLVLAVMSWPLVTDLAGQGVFQRPDGRLNAWILAWDAFALLHAPLRLFDAPIFYPLPDALAFSENLVLPGILTLPAQLLGGPALAYNLALLFGDAISGLGVHLLVRRATGDRVAAFVGGAFFAAGIHRWVNLAHLHAQLTPFLPFAILAFDRFLERRSLPRAAAVGVLLALQGATSIYVGAITATLLAVAVALSVLSRRFGAADLARLFAGAAVAVLLLSPLARPYLRMRAFQGEEFRLETVAAYATTPESYAASAGRFYEGMTRRHLDPDRVHDPLFPGVLPLALGVAGLAVAPRRYAVVAVLGSLAAVFLSLGPATDLYRLLHENLVLFRGIRALARFSLVPVFALAVLLGLALAGRRWLRGAALLLLLLEANLAPLRYERYEPPSAAARWLSGKPGAVVSLPLGEGDTAAMLDAITHFRPLVNGDSGFVPRPYSRAMELLNDRFGEEALRLLRAIGVRHVVARQELPLPPAARFGDTSLYEVPGGESAKIPQPAAPRVSLWTPQGPVVDLGREEDVSRVAFEVGEGAWLDRPRVEISNDGLRWHEVAAEASLADATLALYRDPRAGHGEVRFVSQRARFLRLDRRLPARPGTLGAAR